MNETTRSWPPGFMIEPRAEGPSDEIVRGLSALPVANIGDVMGRSSGTTGLMPYHGNPSTILCGPAVTVLARPGDNLMIHKALTMVQPGDVIVVDGAGDVTQAVIGGLMRRTALFRRLGGFVIDGAIRDLLEWAEGGMPVFARGATHRGPSKQGPGMINVPISCAGMVVNPGDVVIGDADGVIAVPAGQAAAVLDRARAHAAREARIGADNDAGTTDPERFDAILRKLGCPL